MNLILVLIIRGWYARGVYDSRIVWFRLGIQHFQRLKKAFIGDQILRQFDPNLAAFLEIDASGYAIAGILSQIYDRKRHPVSFYSCKLNPAEQNYSTPDQELLTIIKIFEHWRYYLEDAKYKMTILIDTANLKTFNIIIGLSRRNIK